MRRDDVAKLRAFRQKDRNFVAALMGAGPVDLDTILERLRSAEGAHPQSVNRATDCLQSWT